MTVSMTTLEARLSRGKILKRELGARSRSIERFPIFILAGILDNLIAELLLPAGKPPDKAKILLCSDRCISSTLDRIAKTVMTAKRNGRSIDVHGPITV